MELAFNIHDIRFSKTAPHDYIHGHVSPARLETLLFPPVVSLGSTPSLSAESCAEIKANEGGDFVNGNKWLVSPSSGDAILTYCDMDVEGLIGRRDRITALSIPL